MKKLFKKTWFQILFFGALVGAVLIVADNQFGLFGGGKKASGTYNGPVSVDKEKTYFTEVSLSEAGYDFGKVKEGDTLSHVFKLTNTGKEPLIIYKSAGSCDCVGTDYPKDMIPPGQVATLTTYFKTIGRKGPQNRTITITCNTEPADIMLTIKADVQ
jgi:Protein of unknown function (DUF1573)